MLLLGGAATVEALTGMNYELASFLIPWGVILYTSAGGLKATFMASYFHTVIIFAVLITMITIVYIKVYSSNQIYQFLDQTISYTAEECAAIYSNDDGESFFLNSDGAKTMACGPVAGNSQGSYLTMLSADGLMFGIINIGTSCRVVCLVNVTLLTPFSALQSVTSEPSLSTNHTGSLLSRPVHRQLPNDTFSEESAGESLFAGSWSLSPFFSQAYFEGSPSPSRLPLRSDWPRRLSCFQSTLARLEVGWCPPPLPITF